MSFSKYARGGEIERECVSCGRTFYAVSYCDYCCKRRAQNARYYHAHAAEIIQNVLRRRKKSE